MVSPPDEPQVMSSGKMYPVEKRRKNMGPIIAKTGVGLVVVSVVTLAGLGVYRFVVPEEVKGEKGPEQVTNIQVQSSYGAAKIAEDFTYYWLSHDIQKAKQYAARGYEFPDDVLKSVEKKKVISFEAIATEQTGEKMVQVTVKGIVAPANSKDKKGRRAVFLSVPVVQGKAGAYGVYDVPTFVPDPGTAKVPSQKEKKSGSFVGADEEEQIKEFLHSFFRQYSSGQPSDLSQYFVDGKSRTTLPSKFVSIQELDTYGKEEGRVKAVTQVLIEINGSRTLQKYELLLKKQGNNWGIEKVTPEIPEKKGDA